MMYYYRLPSHDNKVDKTDSVDEFISQLYSGAQFITDQQLKDLNLDYKYIDKIKNDISRFSERVPLYDVYSNHIFLVSWENVYNRIYEENYRFIDEQFIEDLNDKNSTNENSLENRRFISFYDIKRLTKTYMKIFYKSFVINSSITSCQKPSFGSGMSHIKPYYSINEINYLAYDWNITNQVTLKKSELRELCKKISKYDIPANTLLDHQMYIYRSHAIGLVKYYSLYGSYFMNLYLRQTGCCLPTVYENVDVTRNLYLENQIKIMVKLIKNSPELKRSHTVYRFVEKDNYLQHLKIGDIYQDSSFMSTTRNPFYYKENYAFGYILIKITLPANIKGVGLCIESYSNFPKEEEIILLPSSKYQLISITEDVQNSKFHSDFDLKVQKKYEFRWIDNTYLHIDDKDVSINIIDSVTPEPKLIDIKNFITDPNISYMTISDRLEYFRNNFTNELNQFEAVVGKNRYTFNFESYDSSSVYKQFFYYEQKDGIMITTTNPKYGNINLLMELGPEIHINYYFRYSVTDPSIVVDLDRAEWIEWLSLLAYAIGSRTVVIHSNYTLQYNQNDTSEKQLMKTRYTFSENIYQYMKYKKKMFKFIEVVPHFDYYQIDYLSGVKVTDIIKPSDRNELYRIYKTTQIDNVYDFYIYLVENNPKMVKVLEEQLETIYEPEDNPFNNIQYSLDAWMYLLNAGLIDQVPSDKEFIIKKGSFKKLIGNKKIPKFYNRLRSLVGKKL